MPAGLRSLPAVQPQLQLRFHAIYPPITHKGKGTKVTHNDARAPNFLLKIVLIGAGGWEPESIHVELLQETRFQRYLWPILGQSFGARSA